jgi:hypothetical protein
MKEDRFADNVPTTKETLQQTHDIVDLDIRSAGQIFAKSQVADYIHRGTALEDYNILEFFVNTYDKIIKKSETLARGAPNYVPYMSNYHKNKQCFRVIRRAGHRNLPNFVGRFFPHNDDPSTYEFYCASMLTLLKPWRHLDADLKPTDATWNQIFQSFLTSASDVVLHIISGIQYFHECDLAARSKQEDRTGTALDSFVNRSAEYDAESMVQDYDNYETAQEFSTITEEDLKERLANAIPIRERLHATNALTIAEHVGIFSSLQSSWCVHPSNRLRNAEEADFLLLSQWQLHMEKEVERVNSVNGLQLSEESASTQGNVQIVSFDSLSLTCPSVILIQSEMEMPSVNPDGLNKDQRRAYEIVKGHLQQNLLDEQPRPLRMILYGEGGTGKSKVIQTISEMFLNAGEIR